MQGIVFLSLCLGVLAAVPSPCLALENGLAKLPPMGWNSWNKFACDITEDSVRTAAKRLVDLGLADLGYIYVNIDDCWMAPSRSHEGLYQADPHKFPSGMAAVGDHIHELGLKYGIYTSAGTMTCQKLPGSLDHEEQDAQTFASWGVDYLKYDNCYNRDIPSIDRYSKMRDALKATGRPIVYSLCQWGEQNSWRWAPSVGNLWRTTGDISPNWHSIVNNFLISQAHAPGRTGPGSWADPDMLEIGNGNLTQDEEKSHFALWAFAKAPLILGMDLDAITDESLAIVSNKNLIAVNQDLHSAQAICFLGCNTGVDDSSSSNTNWSVYATTLTGGDTVALVINWSNAMLHNVKLSGQDLAVVPTKTELVTITDSWTDKLVGEFDYTALKSIAVPPLPPHGNVVFRFSIHDNDDMLARSG